MTVKLLNGLSFAFHTATCGTCCTKHQITLQHSNTSRFCFQTFPEYFLIGHFLLNHHLAPSAKDLKNLLSLYEIAGSQKSLKHFGGCCDPHCHPGPPELRQRETLWIKHKHCVGRVQPTPCCFPSCPALHQANRYVSRPLSGLPLIPSLVISAPKIVCFYTSLSVWSCRMCASWPPHTNPHLLLRPPQPLLLPPTRQAALTLRLARPPVGSNWGFDQNYFFHKQSNWLKSFMCFSNH